ncbi:unnamed protein product [Closterium sp. Yama58-4]|nr:unnamed protein product [Closterium sp. Yama58-4]
MKQRRSAEVPDHQRFIGVRRRQWGSWASEICALNYTFRMWLGTFKTPEYAAFVHDIASLAINGARARLNFIWTRRYAARTADIEKRCVGTSSQIHKAAIHAEIMLICKTIMAELPCLPMSAIHAKMSNAVTSAEPVETRPLVDHFNNCEAASSVTSINVEPQLFQESRRLDLCKCP